MTQRRVRASAGAVYFVWSHARPPWHYKSMETRHLIDGIVQQTTVLIAQLSTAAGIRAPLSGLADQVFLNLAHELEAQGVGRKVAADMFGLALRSYQLKISRIAESTTAREHTLWEAVLEQLRKQGGCSRRVLLEQFAKDDPTDVAAVIKDLVDSGLVSRAGRGDHSYYQVASSEAVAAMAEQQGFDAVTSLVWLAIYDREQVERRQIVAELSFERDSTERAIDALLRDGRIARESHDGRELLVCRKLAIPVGSEQGWEAAVFDHFRAVATSIAAKLRSKSSGPARGDVVGGSTLTFSVCEGHPFEKDVYGLLARVRTDLNELWNRVSAYNDAHLIDAAVRSEVTFYFGQNVVAAASEGRDER